MQFLLLFATLIPLSLMPGLNMLLAFSFGLRLRYGLVLWVIFGELLGLGIVVILCAFFLQFLMNHELIFTILKLIGSLFLLYLSVSLFRAKSEIKEQEISKKSKAKLALQGFLVSFSNPKAWIFFLALLPSFINLGLFKLVFIVLFIEFCSLNIYALGGSVFKKFMNKYLIFVNKFSAICLGILAIFMLIDL